MKLPAPFVRLPLRFDVARMQQEMAAVAPTAWAPHPNLIPGNSALRLITVGGGENDAVAGAMAPTPHLQQSPYLQQVLSSFGVVWSRSRLMKLGAGSTVPEHTDVNYHWFHRVRLHIPIVTTPDVRFYCGDEGVHMAAGEAWVFDNWRIHKVDNPSSQDRVHLVADTTGNGQFWQMVAAARAGAGERLVPFNPAARPLLATEQFNVYRVMPPAEVDQLLYDLVSETVSPRPDEAGRAEVEAFGRLIDAFCKDWRQVWSLFADTDRGLPHYRRRLAMLQQQAEAAAADLTVGSNGLPVVRVIADRMAAYAINEAVGGLAISAPAASPAAPAAARRPPRFDRPVIIVAAPRSGSTALFETLTPTPQLWTVGGEAHWLVEGVPALAPGAPGIESNRLTADQFDARLGGVLQTRLAEHLRDGADQPLADQDSVRLLEKTPKNALRIPFFDALFPDARFVFLWRDPRQNISSIIEAWRDGGWVTYPQLPDWDGPWSLLLPPGWRKLRGRPLAEVAAYQWSETNRVIMDDLAALAPERRHVLSYADFVRDPAAAVRDICAFADIAFDEALTRRTAAALPPSRYTLTPPDPGKWRVNAAEIEPLTAGLAPLLDRLQRFR